jgi:uncharacterized protein YidB (DUF937 family)
MKLEDLMKEAGGIAEFVQKNPAIVAAAVSMLSAKKGTIGPADGLGGLVSAFQNKGLGDVMASWVSGGPNQAITPGQLSDALGHDTITQFGQQSGLSHAEAGSVLASLLPVLVNQLTPQGQVPPPASLESTLGSLLGSLAR